MRGFRILADGLISAELTPGEVMLLADLGMQFRSLLEAVGERARDDAADGFSDAEASRLLAAGPDRPGDGRGAGEGPDASDAASSFDSIFDEELRGETAGAHEFGQGSPAETGGDASDDVADDDASDDDDTADEADGGEVGADLDPVWDDPAVRRLFPDAYPEDPEASADFRRYTIEGQTDRKLENIETLIASLVNGRDPEAIAATLSGADDVVVRLGAEQVQAWIRSLTDLRLTLAARLGIEDDGDEPDPVDDDAAAIHDIYDWLGWVQDSLVTTLSTGLPA